MVSEQFKKVALESNDVVYKNKLPTFLSRRLLSFFIELNNTPERMQALSKLNKNELIVTSEITNGKKTIGHATEISSGSVNAPTLVLFSGIGSDHATTVELAKQRAEEGYNALVISASNTNGDLFASAKLAKHILQKKIENQEIKTEKLIITGHSFGGMTASLVAQAINKDLPELKKARLITISTFSSLGKALSETVKSTVSPYKPPNKIVSRIADGIGRIANLFLSIIGHSYDADKIHKDTGGIQTHIYVGQETGGERNTREREELKRKKYVASAVPHMAETAKEKFAANKSNSKINVESIKVNSYEALLKQKSENVLKLSYSKENLVKMTEDAHRERVSSVFVKGIKSEVIREFIDGLAPEKKTSFYQILQTVDNHFSFKNGSTYTGEVDRLVNEFMSDKKNVRLSIGMTLHTNGFYKGLGAILNSDLYRTQAGVKIAQPHSVQILNRSMREKAKKQPPSSTHGEVCGIPFEKKNDQAGAISYVFGKQDIPENFQATVKKVVSEANLPDYDEENFTIENEQFTVIIYQSDDDKFLQQLGTTLGKLQKATDSLPDSDTSSQHSLKDKEKVQDAESRAAFSPTRSP